VAAGHDSKQAEKTYLSRTGGSTWEREKPFPPAGTELFEESLELLNDFLVAMRLLQPSPGDRILDLGAGGGWCSDLLQRLNRRPVAVDISLEMLRVARQRTTRTPIQAVAGDAEHLPFASGSFDKAVCLSALHHVPDMAAAVREIFRVLNRTGVAVFSEPGVGHAEKPWSVSASRDFGVLEQEVLIHPLLRLCRDAGFAHAHVCPITYVIPEFELSDEDWLAWTRLPRRKRPLRALEKIWRGMLEFAGVAKGSVLFEEAFAMRLVRLLQVPVEEHPFILAAKSDERRRMRPTYRATIDVDPLVADAAPDAPIAAAVKLANTGSEPWRSAGPPGSGHVRIGIQLLDSAARVIARDFARAALPADVAPGASVAVTTTFNAPSTPGEYRLKFDLVAEGVAWFEPGGTKVEIRPLRVRPPGVTG
jgi:SAM-dependent methyltransferase